MLAARDGAVTVWVSEALQEMHGLGAGQTLRLPLLLTALAATLATPLAGAQSLKELHELARGHDAAFLAARAGAESARHRSAQAEALPPGLKP